MAHRMREASTMDEIESSERRSVVNSIKEGFEDFKTVMKTSTLCLSLKSHLTIFSL